MSIGTAGLGLVDAAFAMRDDTDEIAYKGAGMTEEDEQTTEFVIEKLGELVLVLLGEYVPLDKNTEKVRWDSRKIFMDLGTWAAKHGRADLMPLLHKQATRIETMEPRRSTAEKGST